MAVYDTLISMVVKDLENHVDINIKEDEYGTVFIEQNDRQIGIEKKDLWALADALKDVAEKLP